MTQVVTGSRLVTHQFLARLICARACYSAMMMNVDPAAFNEALRWLQYDVKDDEEIKALVLNNKDILIE